MWAVPCASIYQILQLGLAFHSYASESFTSLAVEAEASETQTTAKKRSAFIFSAMRTELLLLACQIPWFGLRSTINGHGRLVGMPGLGLTKIMRLYDLHHPVS